MEFCTGRGGLTFIARLSIRDTKDQSAPVLAGLPYLAGGLGSNRIIDNETVRPLVLCADAVIRLVSPKNWSLYARGHDLNLKNIAKMVLGISGWNIVGEVPRLDKAVYIAAPHTSNWDGFWLLVAKLALGLDARFLAKHTLFWWPLGPILSCLGAIPIDRSSGAGVVPLLIKMFEQSKRLNLALAPEGTRKWMPHWKTGFYHLSVEAGVPLVLAFIDYGSKKMGIGGTFSPSGDQEKDLEYLRDFYTRWKPRHPENMGPIAFPQ